MDLDTSPTGEPAAPEQVGLALRAVLFGTLLGTGAIAAVLWAVRTLQLAHPPGPVPDLSSPAANLLFAGTLAGLLLAAVATWSVLGPLGSAYRRGAFAMVAGFATPVVSLVTMPVEQLFGRIGLLTLAVVSTLSCLLLFRRARGRT
jgi:branched-subunit amino acid permease